MLHVSDVGASRDTADRRSGTGPSARAGPALDRQATSPSIVHEQCGVPVRGSRSRSTTSSADASVTGAATRHGWCRIPVPRRVPIGRCVLARRSRGEPASQCHGRVRAVPDARLGPPMDLTILLVPATAAPLSKRSDSSSPAPRPRGLRFESGSSSSRLGRRLSRPGGRHVRRRLRAQPMRFRRVLTARPGLGHPAHRTDLVAMFDDDDLMLEPTFNASRTHPGRGGCLRDGYRYAYPDP